MDCLRCELVRAKLKVPLLLLMGFDRELIAAHLTATYNAVYYVSCGNIWRKSNTPNSAPYLIG